MKIGYTSVNRSYDQELLKQKINELEELGCKNIYFDIWEDLTFSKSELKLLKEEIVRGTTLCVSNIFDLKGWKNICDILMLLISTEDCALQWRGQVFKEETLVALFNACQDWFVMKSEKISEGLKKNKGGALSEYSKSEKQHAVLLMLYSGKTIKSLAAQYCVSTQTLYRWKLLYKDKVIKRQES